MNQQPDNEKIRENLLRKKIILCGSDKRFYDKYCSRLHFLYGCTLENTHGIEILNSRDCSLELLPLHEFLSRPHDREEMVILWDSTYFDYNVEVIERAGFVEYDSWIHAAYAEALLDEKKIMLVVGVCTVLRMSEVLATIPEVSSRYLFYKVQVDHTPGIRRLKKTLHHLISASEVFLWTDLGDEYDPLSPKNLNLPISFKEYKVPMMRTNFLLPQGKHSIFTLQNPYFIPGQKVLPFDCIDKNIIKCMEDGMGAAETLEYCCDEKLYSMNELHANMNKAIRIMEMLEYDCNIKVTSYFRDLYQDTRLLWDTDHIHFNLTRILVLKLCEMMEIDVQDKELENAAITYRYFHSEAPIYPSVYHQLRLKYVNDDTKYRVMFESGDRYLTFEEYIMLYYDYISTVKRIREFY